MGLFSNMFGGKKETPSKSVSPEDLVKSSVQDGMLYNVESSTASHHEVFFFETDSQKISFRELSTDGRKKSISFERLGRFQISIAGKVQSEQEEIRLNQVIYKRETDSFYGFYFLDNKGLEKDWLDGLLVRDENDILIVKKSPKAKKEFSVRKCLIYDIIFHTKEDIS